MANRRGKGGSSERFPLHGLQSHCRWLTVANTVGLSLRRMSSWSPVAPTTALSQHSRGNDHTERPASPRRFSIPSSLVALPSLRIKSDFKMVPKEIKPEYLLEGRMLKLRLQYFGHLMRRANSLEKTLMLGKTEGRRRRG